MLSPSAMTSLDHIRLYVRNDRQAIIKMLGPLATDIRSYRINGQSCNYWPQAKWTMIRRHFKRADLQPAEIGSLVRAFELFSRASKHIPLLALVVAGFDTSYFVSKTIAVVLDELGILEVLHAVQVANYLQRPLTTNPMQRTPISGLGDSHVPAESKRETSDSCTQGSNSSRKPRCARDFRRQLYRETGRKC